MNRRVKFLHRTGIHIPAPNGRCVLCHRKLTEKQRLTTTLVIALIPVTLLFAKFFLPLLGVTGFLSVDLILQLWMLRERGGRQDFTSPRREKQ